MKKLAVNTFSLLFIVSISVFGIEYIYKDYINPVDYRLKPLEFIGTEVETLILGASHTQALGNKFIFENRKCYNASLGGQDLLHSYLILKSFAQKMNNLKSVIIELEYHSLGYNLDHFQQSWKDRQYYKYTHELENNNWLNILLAKSNFYRSNRDLSYIYRILFGKPQIPLNNEEIMKSWNSDENNLNENNFIPLNDRNFNSADCEKRALEHSKIKYSKDLIRLNEHVLLKIIKLCKDKKIKLFLLNTPKTNCYEKFYNYHEDVKVRKEKIEWIAKKNNVKYYDFFNNNNFNDKDFIDFDHLNKSGVDKLIKLIKQN